jgi:hypothetical protein
MALTSIQFINVFKGLFNPQPQTTDDALIQNTLYWEEGWQKAADDSMASDATTNFAFGFSRRAGTVVGAYYVTNAALTGHASNNATLTVSKYTAAGASITTVASLTTTASWTAKTAVALTLSTVAGALDLEALAPLSFAIAKNSSGVVVPAGRLVVLVQPLQT